MAGYRSALQAARQEYSALQAVRWGRPRGRLHRSWNVLQGVHRKRGRVVECTGLENRRGETHREFESHRFRHILNKIKVLKNILGFVPHRRP